jgi:protein-S-isoprenylcysteine O-methyltransferase Ste14
MSLKLKQYFGQPGEWWVIVQGLLLLGLIILPPMPIILLDSAAKINIYLYDGVAIILGLTALILMVKGVLDLGQNLMPLPDSKPGGTLMTTGIHRSVRHPPYSGLIFAALVGWVLFQASLSHLQRNSNLIYFSRFESEERRKLVETNLSQLHRI